MENDPERWHEQAWTIPVEAWPKLIRRRDKWTLEAFYGAVQLPVSEKDALRIIAVLERHYVEQRERK